MAITHEVKVDLSQVRGDIQRLLQSSQEADVRAARAAARVETLADRLNRLQARAREFNADLDRAQRRAVRTIGRAAATFAIGEILTEIGIPEAAAPVVRIGTATLAGAQAAGVAGATVGFAISLAREGIAGLRKTSRDLEALKVRHLELHERYQRKFREIDEKAIEMDKRIQRELEKDLERVSEEHRELVHQTARAEALGLFN